MTVTSRWRTRIDKAMLACDIADRRDITGPDSARAWRHFHAVLVARHEYMRHLRTHTSRRHRARRPR